MPRRILFVMLFSSLLALSTWSWAEDSPPPARVAPTEEASTIALTPMLGPFLDLTKLAEASATGTACEDFSPPETFPLEENEGEGFYLLPEGFCDGDLFASVVYRDAKGALYFRENQAWDTTSRSDESVRLFETPLELPPGWAVKGMMISSRMWSLRHDGCDASEIAADDADPKACECPAVGEGVERTEVLICQVTPGVMAACASVTTRHLETGYTTCNEDSPEDTARVNREQQVGFSNGSIVINGRSLTPIVKRPEAPEKKTRP